MFPEFGQAPLCLELDLDSYEGSWTHMAAFRGRGGWLTAARATIQSERDLMRATLIAACDEYENPIPSWRAAQLATCDWSDLSDCRELPPDLLDELLCEEEGAFFARWQRQTNGELVALHERAQHDLAALDARAAAVQRQADREIADLQRRRRMVEALPEHRAALGHLIAQIEAETDRAAALAATERRALRREIDRAEEALWDRGDVLVEVEPLWCVRWQAVTARRLHPAPRIGGNQTRVTGGKPLVAPGQIVTTLIVEPPKKEVVFTPRVRAAPLRPAPPPDPAPSPSLATMRATVDASTLEQQVAALRACLTRLDRPRPRGVAASPRRLAIQRAMLTEEIARLTGLPVEQSLDAPATTPIAAAPPLVEIVIAEPPAREPAPPIAPVIAVAPAQAAPPPAPLLATPPDDGLVAEQRERRLLQLRLDATVAAGERLRGGSPKFQRHQAAVAEMRGKLVALDALLGEAPTPPSRETLAEDRAVLAAELAAHERRGALASDGVQRFLRYTVRRQALMADIARIDRRLARPTPPPVTVAPATPVGPDPAIVATLVADRARLAADLDLLERAGVEDQDDPRARIRFTARQAELAARLARADLTLAHARAGLRTRA